MAAISAKKLRDVNEGKLQNNYLYQGAYSELDEDLGWTDFALRSYDAQIGRFMQADPFDQFASGYIGMGNDPANLVDPSGGDRLTLRLGSTAKDKNFVFFKKFMGSV